MVFVCDPLARRPHTQRGPRRTACRLDGARAVVHHVHRCGASAVRVGPPVPGRWRLGGGGATRPAAPRRCHTRPRRRCRARHRPFCRRWRREHHTQDCCASCSIPWRDTPCPAAWSRWQGRAWPEAPRGWMPGGAPRSRGGLRPDPSRPKTPRLFGAPGAVARILPLPPYAFTPQGCE